LLFILSHSYSFLTVKKLYSLHNNQCAFPGCKQELITTDKGINVSDMCHIEGGDEKSPRYNPSLGPAELNDYENLILMCKVHHKIIDTDTATFTVSYLKKLKNKHEKNQNGQLYTISDAVAKNIIAEQMTQVNVNAGSGIQNITQKGDIIHYENPPTPDGPLKIFDHIPRTCILCGSMNIKHLEGFQMNGRERRNRTCRDCGAIMILADGIGG